MVGDTEIGGLVDVIGLDEVEIPFQRRDNALCLVRLACSGRAGTPVGGRGFPGCLVFHNREVH